MNKEIVIDIIEARLPLIGKAVASLNKLEKTVDFDQRNLVDSDGVTVAECEPTWAHSVMASVFTVALPNGSTMVVDSLLAWAEFSADAILGGNAWDQAFGAAPRAPLAITASSSVAEVQAIPSAYALELGLKIVGVKGAAELDRTLENHPTLGGYVEVRVGRLEERVGRLGRAHFEADEQGDLLILSASCASGMAKQRRQFENELADTELVSGEAYRFAKEGALEIHVARGGYVDVRFGGESNVTRVAFGDAGVVCTILDGDSESADAILDVEIAEAPKSLGNAASAFAGLLDLF